MKIISYNVNGIRAALKKGFIDWLKNTDPDVICLQEIKAEKEQLDLSVFNQAGYDYNYWFSAKKKVTVESQYCQKLNQLMWFLELELNQWILRVAIFVLTLKIYPL